MRSSLLCEEEGVLLHFYAEKQKRTQKSPQSVVLLSMNKHITYHEDYTGFGDAYRLFFPLNLEGLIPNDESV